jgi:hypothetical protein
MPASGISLVDANVWLALAVEPPGLTAVFKSLTLTPQPAQKRCNKWTNRPGIGGGGKGFLLSLDHRTRVAGHIRGRSRRTDDERARGPGRETRLQFDHNNPWWSKRRQGEDARIPRPSRNVATERFDRRL